MTRKFDVITIGTGSAATGCRHTFQRQKCVDGFYGKRWDFGGGYLEIWRFRMRPMVFPSLDRAAYVIPSGQHGHFRLEASPMAGPLEDGPERSYLDIHCLWRGIFAEPLFLVAGYVTGLESHASLRPSSGRRCARLAFSIWTDRGARAAFFMSSHSRTVENEIHGPNLALP
jgi:hypothetical protein